MNYNKGAKHLSSSYNVNSVGNIWNMATYFFSFYPFFLSLHLLWLDPSSEGGLRSWIVPLH